MQDEFCWLPHSSHSTHSQLVTLSAESPVIEQPCPSNFNVIKDFLPWGVLVIVSLVSVSLCVMLSTLIFEHLNCVCNLQYLQSGSEQTSYDYLGVPKTVAESRKQHKNITFQI